jgi:hypothetical protein
MILNILKNSKIIKLIFFNLLISFLFLSLFLFVKAQQTSDVKECRRYGNPDCEGLIPPVTVCYNGWVPGKKTDCGPSCPYSIYNNEFGYGRPWSKYTWTTRCVRFIDPDEPKKAYCYLEKTYQNWYSLGDKAEPGCPNCGSRKTGYLASGQCDPRVSGGFLKFVVNQTEQLV